MRLPFRLLGVAALLACGLSGTAHPQSQTPKPTSPFYEENVAASNPVRTEQVRELDAYINALKEDRSRLRELFRPDYSSERAYQASTRKLWETFERSIGYPPPGKPDAETPQFTRIGEDHLGVYYRARISVLPGVHAVGIYITPKNVKGRVPLIVSMHGGGGAPEIALFNGGANYHDMVRGGVKRGYAVWAPTHLFRAEGYPQNIRMQIDDRARLVGTSITAIEIAKITRSLDVILKRPEVDPNRVGMVGLSYGGFYTLVTMAVEPRIKAGVSSCYFGVQEWRYERDQLGVPSDFRTMDRFTLLRDPELVALICPRPLLIQAGAGDNASHREGGEQLAPEAAAYYRGLDRESRFKFLVFDGKHEFHDDSAWSFVRQHL